MIWTGHDPIATSPVSVTTTDEVYLEKWTIVSGTVGEIVTKNLLKDVCGDVLSGDGVLGNTFLITTHLERFAFSRLKR
jgi:hypothetical protein